MNRLKICFWNANGIRQHKNEVEYFLKNKEIDIMLISETHLTSRSLFKINGFVFYDTKDPRDRACGGSAILIKARIKHYLMCDFCEDYLQATTICLEDFHRNLVISSVYFPPRFSITEDQYRNFYKSLGPRFLAAGDYNAKHTFWGSRLISPKGRVLFDTISKMDLDVISSGQPTYWPSDPRKIPDIIDFGVLKNIPREILQVESSLELSSDHSPTILTLLSHREIVSPTGNLATTGTKINWLKYKKYISTHCTENIPLSSSEDIDLSISDLVKNLKLASQHATLPPRHIRYNRIYSVDVERLLTEKRRARREWQLHRSPQLKNKLKDCTKRLKKLLEKQKTESVNKYIENLDATPQSDYSLWKATKNLKRPVTYKPPLRNESGGWARNNVEKANLFVNHLNDVFKPNVSNFEVELPPVVQQVREVAPIRFEIREIEKAIVDLNSKKAPGIDGISNKMLMELPLVALKIILFIFNAILRLKYYPPEWKVSLITMIPKPGKDHTKVDSYRPISLLPNMSKLFEKLLIQKLHPIINESSYIPNHQFGFRSKHSTIEQTHRLVNSIRKTFEEKKYCSALFIDVSQAFDKVWHEGLIYKLRKFFPENIHQLLKSYLTDRKFIVKEKDYLSTPQPINAGVPQGSILGPILYILYTSDMPTNIHTCTSTFADDTAILSINADPQQASRYLQNHIYELEKWLRQWKIKVNEQKCIHITFTLRRETCPPIKINNQPINQESHVKYLGIHLDRRLTWKTHIDAKLTQIKLKVAQINWLIGKNSRLSLDCKLLLYKSIIKPIWCYGIQLWGTASASTIEKIQRRQNKILRMITGAPWYIKNSNIHKDLNMPLVKDEISNYVGKYLAKLVSHPNPLARNILNYRGHNRLRRRDTGDLSRQQEGTMQS